MIKKKNSTFDDIMDVTKLTIGVGVASGIANTITKNAPQATQKPIQGVITMMGTIPLLTASKTVLQHLKDWDDDIEL